MSKRRGNLSVWNTLGTPTLPEIEHEQPSIVKPTAMTPPSPGIINWRTFDPSCLTDGDQSTLAVELVTYRDRLDELLEHEGQFVVIKGRLVLGYYRDRRTALAAAHAEFGTSPVLIKQVVECEPVRRVGNVKLCFPG